MSAALGTSPAGHRILPGVRQRPKLDSVGGAAAAEWFEAVLPCSAVEDNLLVRADGIATVGKHGRGNSDFVSARLCGSWNTPDHKPSRLREILIANLAKTCLL